MNKKTIKNMAKAMALFHQQFELEEKKLYDKQKHTELSHNRKWHLLKEIYNKLDFIKQNFESASLNLELTQIQNKIYIELNQNGRVNWGTK